MKKDIRFFGAVVVTLCLLWFSPLAQATTLFYEDFEGDLSAWTGKFGEAHHGLIVDDPLEPDKALRFTEMNMMGDIFSPMIENPGGKYTISFDYLGKGTASSVPNDFGGFVGYYSEDLWRDHQWLAGTRPETEYVHDEFIDSLADDGSWHTYQIAFTGPTGLHLMLEDFVLSYGAAGDAYFDNILLTDENGITPTTHSPLPPTMLLFAPGLALLPVLRRRYGD